MGKRNIQHGQRSRRGQKRWTHKMIIFVFGFILITTVLFFVISNSASEKVLSVRPTDRQPGMTRSNGVPESRTQMTNLQAFGKNPEWNLTLVNKEHPIPEDYEINLVEVAGGEMVDERIYEPLMEMLEAAKEGNWYQLPKVVSGYRTQEKQQELYDEKIAKYKREGYSNEEAVRQAEQWVAVPGYSEHQLGFAVDINGATYDLYVWLQENSYKYGFIFRYPGSKTNLTGTAEEVWHYRYVGVEAATEMYEQGLCLEEYLEKKNL